MFDIPGIEHPTAICFLAFLLVSCHLAYSSANCCFSTSNLLIISFCCWSVIFESDMFTLADFWCCLLLVLEKNEKKASRLFILDFRYKNEIFLYWEFQFLHTIIKRDFWVWVFFSIIMNLADLCAAALLKYTTPLKVKRPYSSIRSPTTRLINIKLHKLTHHTNIEELIEELTCCKHNCLHKLSVSNIAENRVKYLLYCCVSLFYIVR